MEDSLENNLEEDDGRVSRVLRIICMQVMHVHHVSGGLLVALSARDRE